MDIWFPFFLPLNLHQIMNKNKNVSFFKKRAMSIKTHEFQILRHCCKVTMLTRVICCIYKQAH